MNFEHPDHPPGRVAAARRLRRRSTWAERQMWKHLRSLAFNFRRQAPIGPFIVDFASHRAGLVIEVDGGIHERLDDVALRDGERQLWLQSQGYRVLRFTNQQVENDVAGCVAQVTTVLRGKGWTPADAEDASTQPHVPARGRR
ncbi:MAG: DUF559 domain-containing protein [Phenylobacterium sp.]|uniref:endonuclease domain-containing protein n=1 Tax=Phenylobacterium sp. TaxID=1871053 RepID=UPI001A4DF7C1|nr:endonuclease domain-containing protein [Phenylobacterium sp.]MBL8772926.1 DUF559 domain-containing protein [Phenylobacterium sp.]